MNYDPVSEEDGEVVSSVFCDTLQSVPSTRLSLVINTADILN